MEVDKNHGTYYSSYNCKLCHNFEEEKITPDIICLLSPQDFAQLGLTDRSKIMELRTLCVHFSNIVLIKDCKKFFIPKDTLESLLEMNLTVREISEMSNVSESTIYGNMKMYNLSKLKFTDILDDDLDAVVSKLVSELSTAHNDISAAHNDISTAHNEISTAHNEISTAHNDISTEHNTISTTEDSYGVPHK